MSVYRFQAQPSTLYPKPNPDSGVRILGATLNPVSLTQPPKAFTHLDVCIPGITLNPISQTQPPNPNPRTSISVYAF